MKKKLLLVFIILGIGIVVLLIGKSESIYRERGCGIQQLLNAAIQIQYGWKNIDKLNQICTEEFFENTDLDEVYVGRRFYMIEKGYMDTVREVNENELEITVSVYSPDIRFHHFTIIQDKDGKYLIDKIEHDM